MIVLDTNVLSELMKRFPSHEVVAWADASDATELYTTSITLAEVLYGVERLPDGRRKGLVRDAALDVFSAFADRILAFDDHAAVHYAELVAERERGGSPIHGFDAQIAAICRREGAALATRDTRDFNDLGLELVDPWQ